MIIIGANGQSITVALDTIQAKAMMHILRYVLEDPQANAEIYAAKRMAETGLAIPVKDLMILVGQIAVTMGRVLTEAEVAAEQERALLTAGDEEHDEACPEHPQNKTKPVEIKSKTKEGDWKN